MPYQMPPQAYGQPMNPGAGQYDPFDPAYLYAPMAQQMDTAANANIAQLNEKFGAQGARWSSPLMNAQAMALANTGNQKQQLLSQLLYQGAQDKYKRQSDAANMAMNLGNMQNQRDTTIAQLMQSLGAQQQGVMQSDLDRYYQEWLRTSQGYLPMLLGALGHGYQSDYTQKPSAADQWGPWLSALGQGLGSYYGSK